MGIQILPAEGTLASRVGAGFGKGLADQLPQEIQRYRLQSGLKALGEQQGQRTPFETVAGLAGIPGLDPSLMGVLAPLLQQQMIRQEGLNAGGMAGGGQPFQGQGSQSYNVPTERTQVGQVGRAQEPATPFRREEQTGYLQRATPQEVETLKNDLMRTRPYTFPTEDVARARANEILGQRYESDVTHQAKIDLTRKEFEDQATSVLQKAGLDKEGEIGGLTYNTLRQRALEEASERPASAKSIGQKYVNELLDIAKEKQTMKKVYNSWNKLSPPTSKDVDSLKGLKEKYDKHKIPTDVFIDDLVSSQHISRSAASYLADNLANTEAGKFMYSIKPVSKGVGNIYRGGKDPEVEIAKQLAPKITNDDLMGSIAYIAEQKGLDGNKLLGELQRILDPSKISTEQGRDLKDKQIPALRSLDEVWLMGLNRNEGKPRR